MASVSLIDLSVELERRSILDRVSLDVDDGTFAAVRRTVGDRQVDPAAGDRRAGRCRWADRSTSTVST